MTLHLEQLPNANMPPPVRTFFIALSDKDYSLEDLKQLFLSLKRLFNEQDIFRLLAHLIDEGKIEIFKVIVDSGNIILKDLDMTIAKPFQYKHDQNNQIMIDLRHQDISEEDSLEAYILFASKTDYKAYFNLLDLALYQQCEPEFIKFLLREELRASTPDKLHLAFEDNKLQEQYSQKPRIQLSYYDEYCHVLEMYEAIQKAEACLKEKKHYAFGAIHNVLSRYQHLEMAAETILYEYVADQVQDIIDDYIRADQAIGSTYIEENSKRALEFCKFIEGTINQADKTHAHALEEKWHHTLKEGPIIAADVSQFKDEAFADWAKGIKKILQDKYLSSGWKAQFHRTDTLGKQNFFQPAPIHEDQDNITSVQNLF
jgi:hypothetical protein